MRRLPLNALRAFRAVAEHGSFAAAADVLSVTQAAVSAAVISLESYVGVKLFRRLPRGVELTTEGRLLFEEVRPSFDRISSLLQVLSRRRSAQELTVTMLPSFAELWLLPRLNRFRDQAESVSLRIYTDKRVLDLGANRIHAGIRFGRGQWPGVRAERLFGDWTVAVCSPGYARRARRIRVPADLQAHYRIESSSESWEEWFAHARVRGRRTPPALSIDDSGVALAAVRYGLGVGLVRWSYAQADIAAGTLRLVAQNHCPTVYEYYLAWPPEIETNTAFSQFRKWLLEEARSFPPPPSR